MAFAPVASFLRNSRRRLPSRKRAISAGVHPVRVVMHRDDATASPIRRSVNIGVGRFVVNSPSQVALLVSCAERSQRVVVDEADDGKTGLSQQGDDWVIQTKLGDTTIALIVIGTAAA